VPSPEQILSNLSLAANNFYIVSIFWHLLVMVFFIAILSGKKFSMKQVLAFLTLPLSSVAIIAVLTSNPFNGIVFGVLRLGVYLDLVLIAGALALLIYSIYVKRMTSQIGGSFNKPQIHRLV
jgi:hypothetical protein